MFATKTIVLSGAAILALTAAAEPPPRKTEVAIHGQAFHINGRPTYAGRSYNGMKLEGLLMNARLVQAAFDDLNPETRSRWAYPDGPWDPDRNTREFLAAMPLWREHGLLAFTLNLQGGSPEGYSKSQPWHNSAFTSDGGLRPEFMARLERVLDRADELGMAVLLGLFYFGQDERLADEAAVVRGVDNAVDWLLDRGYRHVLIEVNNECNVRYDHAILRPDRVHELIGRVQARQRGGRRLLAGTSYGGGTIPKENVVRVSDFLLLHGNGVREPDRLRKMVDDTRALPAYRDQPILFNEDDHFDFDQPDNNMLAAVSRYASWGYFDFRMKGEGFDEGYQSVPVNWGISSARKRGFFDLLRRITRGPANEAPDPVGGALAGERFRVIVSTDIGGSDPDDFQSMVHYLAYADLFDTEGLVSSPPHAGRAAHIHEALDAYARDYPKLRARSPRYPTPDALRAVTKQGATDAAPPQGWSEPTEGSRWISERARAADPRPLWVLVWGSITDVAQALHDAPEIAPKLRVYSIGSWNTRMDPHARDYVVKRHPDLWLIEADTTFRGMYVGGAQEGDLGNDSFVARDVKGHGALGDLFHAKKPDLKMGDTPSVLYLLRGPSEEPYADHWGGAFVRRDTGPNHWADNTDPELREKNYAGAKTVSRWREAYLRDWQSRMEPACTEHDHE